MARDGFGKATPPTLQGFHFAASSQLALNTLPLHDSGNDGSAFATEIRTHIFGLSSQRDGFTFLNSKVKQR
jgi:hypothetical protein